MSNTEILGKQLTFTELVNEYSDKLYSWAFHKTSNKELAEDLVQETFLAAYKSFESFEGNSSTKTWLTSILNNKIIDYYRQKSKTFVFLDASESQAALNKSDSFFDENESWVESNTSNFWDNEKQLLDNDEFVFALEGCYDKLPINWKKAIQSKYILNVDAKQICNELNISTTNYWKVIQRSKLLLKQCLETSWFK